MFWLFTAGTTTHAGVPDNERALFFELQPEIQLV
ncbi:hypothetical protein EHP00_1367 [Ecytonucleospora hepatopenaei]|uniref:Uncharacterized protein n=1 Tax=Ecytonucleospora hepatopenaei TaxID=646526 RepID=A0A1W0E2Z2_9MICR|nr:hypothetical protein EHP00_1367 [Ecytonucleospora hepatopenaei]